MTTLSPTLQRERTERRQRKLAAWIRILDAVIVIAVGALIGIAIALAILDLLFV